LFTFCCERLRALLHAARERRPDSIVPAHYVLVITEEIGQDRGNDLTRICLVHAGVPNDMVAKELLLDARIFHDEPWH
jgi:hypothetical protein